MEDGPSQTEHIMGIFWIYLDLWFKNIVFSAFVCKKNVFHFICHPPRRLYNARRLFVRLFATLCKNY